MKQLHAHIFYLGCLLFGAISSSCDFKPHNSTGPVILIPAESLEAVAYPTPTLIIQSTISTEILAVPVATPTASSPQQQQTEDVVNDSPQAYQTSEGLAVGKKNEADQKNQNLQAILETNLPARDYLETHVRLTELAWPQNNQPTIWEHGQKRFVHTVDGAVEVRLAAAGVNAYFWVDTRLSISDEAFSPIVRRLDHEIYPSITSIFGQERRPGIDGDNRFHIIHLARLSTRELGYFDSSNAYPSEVFDGSQEEEQIAINLENINLGGDVYYGTLVHELQHLVQWNMDKNESTWLDEGLSQLAELQMGSETFSVNDYIHNNDIQLNSWSYKPEKLYSHYGGSALFVIYLWEKFGDRFIQTLVRNPHDGMAAVRDTLRQTGSDETLQALFRNFLISVYLNDPMLAETNYGFSRYEFDPPKAHQVAFANGETVFESIVNRPQFSGWYIDLPNHRDITVSFVGDSVQTLFDAPSPNSDGSANTVFYVPPHNRVDATLRKTVDLRGIADPSIRFDTWFDMEPGYDYVYLMVSTDGGRHWEMVETSNRVQGIYGPGFSGDSNGWIQPYASLSQWSGEQVIIQFEYITDSAEPGRGFAVDNIMIAGNEPVSSFEHGNDGWETSGFVRTGHLIPQLWTVSIVQKLSNGEVWVQDLTVDSEGKFQQAVSIVENGSLIIAPVSPSTTTSAEFWIRIE